MRNAEFYEISKQDCTKNPSDLNAVIFAIKWGECINEIKQNLPFEINEEGIDVSLRIAIDMTKSKEEYIKVATKW